MLKGERCYLITPKKPVWEVTTSSGPLSFSGWRLCYLATDLDGLQPEQLPVDNRADCSAGGGRVKEHEEPNRSQELGVGCRQQLAAKASSSPEARRGETGRASTHEVDKSQHHSR